MNMDLMSMCTMFIGTVLYNWELRLTLINNNITNIIFIIICNKLITVPIQDGICKNKKIFI